MPYLRLSFFSNYDIKKKKFNLGLLFLLWCNNQTCPKALYLFKSNISKIKSNMYLIFKSR